MHTTILRMFDMLQLQNLWQMDSTQKVHVLDTGNQDVVEGGSTMIERLLNYLGFSVRNTSADSIITDLIITWLTVLIMLALSQKLWPHIKDAVKFVWRRCIVDDFPTCYDPRCFDCNREECEGCTLLK